MRVLKWTMKLYVIKIRPSFMIGRPIAYYHLSPW